MVRFILKRKYYNEHSGMQLFHHETILCDVPELQAAMERGGHSENGYDITEFVGMAVENGATENEGKPS
jgi:hypothetical protein